MSGRIFYLPPSNVPTDKPAADARYWCEEHDREWRPVDPRNPPVDSNQRAAAEAKAKEVVKRYSRRK